MAARKAVKKIEATIPPVLSLDEKVSDWVKKEPYPTVRVGGMLKHSKIPPGEGVRQVVYFDQGTSLQLSINALKTGLTPDEFIRRMMWGLLGEIKS